MNKLALENLYQKLINHINAVENKNIFRHRVLTAYIKTYIAYGTVELDKFFDMIKSLNFETCMDIANREFEEESAYKAYKDADFCGGDWLLTADEIIDEYANGLYYGFCYDSNDENFTELILDILSQEKHFVTTVLSEYDSIVFCDAQNQLITIFNKEIEGYCFGVFSESNARMLSTHDIELQERGYLLNAGTFYDAR